VFWGGPGALFVFTQRMELPLSSSWCPWFRPGCFGVSPRSFLFCLAVDLLRVGASACNYSLHSIRCHKTAASWPAAGWITGAAIGCYALQNATTSAVVQPAFRRSFVCVSAHASHSFWLVHGAQSASSLALHLLGTGGLGVGGAVAGAKTE
jgi:hypothetical protein